MPTGGNSFLVPMGGWERRQGSRPALALNVLVPHEGLEGPLRGVGDSTASAVLVPHEGLEGARRRGGWCGGDEFWFPMRGWKWSRATGGDDVRRTRSRMACRSRGCEAGWRESCDASAVVSGRTRARSEERRVGKEWVRACRFRWSPDHSKKKKGR